MAMAALRCAAGRRLVRPRPAAPGFGRPNLTQAKGLSSHGKEEGVLEQIQDKKERLYDLILYNRAFKRNDGSTCHANVQLLRHLSAHVKPRPQSIAWRCLRNVHSFYIMWMCLSPAASAYAIWNIYKASKSDPPQHDELARNNMGALVQQGGDELGKKNNCISQGEQVVVSSTSSS
ncbi:uncharacterized protein LOC123421856 [Hordeum vulgare subsp. vulgare]|uniref:Uncharacterized protein n=1 Tax=Hordeum vulgare subsp. vulgare TaxID=112509 RepID=A0A8I6WMB8_HORVV|nr:uncharacterized protein LOC123421856 [Hordeum vulgare subsp. vulgare]